MNFQHLTQAINQFHSRTGQFPVSCVLHYEDYMALTGEPGMKDILEIETSKEMLRNGIVAYLKTLIPNLTIMVSRVVHPGDVLCLDEAHHLERLGFK